MAKLQFTCPNCKKHKLGSVEDVFMTYPIITINDDGDFNYDYDNPTSGDGQILAYQCLNCGYELEDEQGNAIQDCERVVEWLKANMSKKK